ncbi:nucleotidyltransferase family protein, partial [Microvirga sp. 3-52]|nr:nucleotidyltransferase family protein [Microvirga sp. 3-52]
ARCQSYCFGSEDGDIEPFNNSLELITNAEYEYEEIVKKSVQEGMSYPKALNSAYQQAIQSSASDRPFADLTKPNNILGFHYLQAARNIQSSMKAAT